MVIFLFVIHIKATSKKLEFYFHFSVCYCLTLVFFLNIQDFGYITVKFPSSPNSGSDDSCTLYLQMSKMHSKKSKHP